MGTTAKGNTKEITMWSTIDHSFVADEVREWGTIVRPTCWTCDDDPEWGLPWCWECADSHTAVDYVVGGFYGACEPHIVRVAMSQPNVSQDIQTVCRCPR